MHTVAALTNQVTLLTDVAVMDWPGLPKGNGLCKTNAL